MSCDKSFDMQSVEPGLRIACLKQLTCCLISNVCKMDSHPSCRRPHKLPAHTFKEHSKLASAPSSFTLTFRRCEPLIMRTLFSGVNTHFQLYRVFSLFGLIVSRLADSDQPSRPLYPPSEVRQHPVARILSVDPIPIRRVALAGCALSTDSGVL
jgi:hypothetical protein